MTASLTKERFTDPERFDAEMKWHDHDHVTLVYVNSPTGRLTDASNYENLRRTANRIADHRDELLTRIAALEQRVNAADRLLDRCLELVRGDIEQFGPCDHDVGCCICGEIRLADDIVAYRALPKEPR